MIGMFLILSLGAGLDSIKNFSVSIYATFILSILIG